MKLLAIGLVARMEEAARQGNSGAVIGHMLAGMFFALLAYSAFCAVRWLTKPGPQR
jgi:hypothetical protein